MELKHRISLRRRPFLQNFFHCIYGKSLPALRATHGTWHMAATRGIFTASILLFSYAAASADFARGEALYGNHCKFCHEAWAHTRTQRKADSLANLKTRVIGWNAHAGLDWGQDEVDDVVFYLNEKFYHFE